MKTKTTKENLEEKFDANEDVSDYFDMNKSFRPGWKTQRVNVDLPMWMVTQLDKESSRLGVARQSLMKIWMAEKLEKLQHI